MKTYKPEEQNQVYVNHWLPFSICIQGLLVILFNFSTSVCYSQPIIQQFSPVSAVPGSTVTIQGSGFSSTASLNQVFFGAVSGNVTAATETNLIVTVPTGATPGAIIVMVSDLSAYSKTSFQPLFAPVYAIDGGTLKTEAFVETGPFPKNVIMSDLNGDGKPDLLVLRYQPNNFDVNQIVAFKNTSVTNGTIAMEQQGTFPVGIFSTDLSLADFDGDGKKDAVAANIGDNKSISVFRNSSTATNINFGTALKIPTFNPCYHLATGDADGDGKIDIIASQLFAGKIILLRNTSTPGNISFAVATTMEGGVGPGMIAFSDLNGDGKPEIAVTNEYDRKVLIFRNNSSPGFFSFPQATSIQLPDGLEPKHVTAEDLNGDQKNDLLITTTNVIGTSGNLFQYQNAGNFSFTNNGILASGAFNGPYLKPSTGDVNGDGKPDLLVGWGNGTFKMGVYQNNSLHGGAIHFDPPLTLNSGNPSQIAIGDLNADGQADVALANLTEYAVQLLQNKSGKLTISIVTPSTAGQGAEVTISGFNLTGITQVKFGNTPAQAFYEVSPNTLKAIIGTGSTGKVEVTGTGGTDFWETFTFSNIPTIDSFLPKMAGAADTVTIRGKNFLGTNEVKFGGMLATWFTVVNATTIKAIPGNGRHGPISIKNPEGSSQLNGFIFLQKPIVVNFTPKEAYIGSIIEIFGTNLALPGIVPTVTLGGEPATVNFIQQDYAYLNVVVKNGSSGHLAVFHPGGSDSIGGFTYIKPPAINSIHPTSGQPGDTIMILGSRFSGLSKVLFGDSAAAYFKVINDSTMLAVVNHGSSGSVQAIGPSGIGYFSGFIFIAGMQPVTTAMSPDEGSTGTLVTLTGQHLFGITSLYVGTVQVRRIVMNAKDKVSFYMPIGANGQVILTTYYGTATLQQPVFRVWLPPQLESFAPLHANAGEIVTISGNGFGNDVGAINVFFGLIKAKIRQCLPNSIVVEVPPAAGFNYISVNIRGLTTSSKRKFNRSNTNTSHFPLHDKLFQITPDPSNQYWGGSNFQPLSADFNNDGLLDVAVLSQVYGTNILKNTSTIGNIKFNNVYQINAGADMWNTSINDLDGDGRPDIYLGYSDVLRNISTDDNILFEKERIAFVYKGLINDMNGDGKPDLITKYERGIRIHLNNSIQGKLSFTDTLHIPVLISENILEYAKLIDVADLDMDGLNDIIIFYYKDIYLLRNTGTLSQPAFNNIMHFQLDIEDPYGYSREFYPSKVAIDDLNQDGRPELTFVHSIYQAQGFSTLMNKSTPGNLSFGPIQLLDMTALDDLQVGDFNGDNKPDLVGFSGAGFLIFENKSTPDSIIMKNTYQHNGKAGLFNVADMDADGKTDIFVLSNYSFRNRLNEKQELVMCANSNITITSELESITYQWQMDTGNGFMDILNEGNFSGVNAKALSLSNVPTSWLNQSFRCKLANGTFSEISSIRFSNSWKRYQTRDWHESNNWSCGVVPDENTDVIIPPFSQVELKNNSSCRSIFLNSNAGLRIMPGVQLTIKEK